MKHLKPTTSLLPAAAALIAAASTLSGCAGDTAASGDAIKIGAILELTGNQAAYGTTALSGAQLAIDEINRAGGLLGRKVEFVPLDDKSEPSEAASAAQKLADAGVVALIAPMTSSNALAAVPITNGSHIPSITPTSTNPKVTVDEKTGEVIPYSFRACFIDPYQGQVMADFVAKDLHMSRVAILVDNSSDYAKGLTQFFTETFTRLGGEVVGTEAYLQKDTDFNATLTKIKNLNPDFIYVPGYYQEVGLIIKQARALGITVPFGGGDGWDNPVLWDIAGADALEGSYYTTLFALEEDNRAVMALVKDYRDRFHEDPSVQAVLSYDCIKLIAQAITEGKSADPESIRDSLESMAVFHGAGGDMTFTPTHDAKKAAFILNIQDGEARLHSKVLAD